MPAYKDKKTGKWYVACYYKSWTGDRQRKTKRGFTTKRAALEWEREFLLTASDSPKMLFREFANVYLKDSKNRTKLSSYKTKEHLIRTKILPYFRKKRLDEITAGDIIKWQNELLEYRDENGKGYSQSYLRTIHNHLSAMFNHACRLYNLGYNPAVKAGAIGSRASRDTEIWTKEDYLKFSEAIMDKPMSFYAFELLYWCGIREGELLALTPSDFDFTNGTLRINKTYNRIERQDIVTDPKTPKSNRVVQMPRFVTEELKEYIEQLYGIQPNDRAFQITKHYLKHEMQRGAEAAGVNPIKIHALRHSHISYLIDLGFSAVEIADRVGHESIDITFRYAHAFPSRQKEMADRLDIERNGGDV